jgi:lysozyme
MAQMMLGAAGTALIKSFETCQLVAYQDQRGRWTLGWGHAEGVRQGDTCTQEQADAWFLTDTAWACKAIMNEVDVALTQNQFDALTSFTFNVGASAFASSTLLRYLNQSLWTAAANEFDRWDHVNGVTNAGLQRRRAAEKALFLTVSPS